MARGPRTTAGIYGLFGNIWKAITTDANGNLSTIAQFVASELHLGQVGGESSVSAVAPTLLGGAAYASGDAVGGIMEFTNVARVSGLGVILKNLLISDLTTQAPTLELWLFDRTFTATVDNTPFSPSDGDMLNLVAIISTNNGDWFVSANQGASDVEVSKRVKPNTTSLFGQLVTRGTPTYAAGALATKLSYLQD